MNNIVTVKDLIEYLENNFKENEYLCYFHEGGAWCEVEHLFRSDFNRWFFKYVKDKRDEDLKITREDCKKYVFESYKDVKDNDVVIY